MIVEPANAVIAAVVPPVTVPPKFNVPAPVKVNLTPPAPLAVAVAPETYIDPEEMVTAVNRVDEVAVEVYDPQEIDPLPMFKVVVPLVAGLTKVSKPLKVSELLLVITIESATEFATVVRVAAVTDAFSVSVVAGVTGVAMALKFSDPDPAFIAAEVPLKVTVPVPGLKVPLLTHGPETVSPKVVVVRIPLFVNPAHVAPVAFIVTVTPLFITTSSLEVGTAAPPQVAVALQFPETLAVFVTAFARDTETKNTTNKTTVLLRIRWYIFPDISLLPDMFICLVIPSAKISILY